MPVLGCGTQNSALDGHRYGAAAHVETWPPLVEISRSVFRHAVGLL
jgi:hypothetical protein